MPEQAKRLAPSLSTLRELFLKSGNLCAFPGCEKLMMNADGVFIGQVCHIEAAEKDGERFNSSMTNEQRRDVSNLMLMCYEHHQVTNDVDRFTVEILRGYKRDHESRFSRPDRAILERLTDWTRLDEPSEAQNLKRFNQVIPSGLTEEELRGSAQLLNSLVTRLKVVPVDVRRFVGAVALRMYRVKHTNAVQTHSRVSDAILASDLRGAFRVGDAAIAQRAKELEAYSLGGITEIYDGEMEHPAVFLRRVEGWPFWLELAEFCEKAPESMDVFTIDLDFGRLDE
jgi:hypothetical protein